MNCKLIDNLKDQTYTIFTEVLTEVQTAYIIDPHYDKDIICDYKSHTFIFYIIFNKVSSLSSLFNVEKKLLQCLDQNNINISIIFTTYLAVMNFIGIDNNSPEEIFEYLQLIYEKK